MRYANNIKAVTKIRWANEDQIERVKFFWSFDEPNAQCASKRPPPTKLENIVHPTMSAEDYRRKEKLIERELNQKVTPTQEKAKEDGIRSSLDNMTPRIFYSSLLSKN